MFKNLIPYKYDNTETDFSNIHKQIKNKDFIFTPLDQFKTSTSGFNRFYDDVYIIESDNRILLKITFSVKNVSDKTVENLLDERIEKIKKDENIEIISAAVREIYTKQIELECLKYTEPVNKSVLLLIDKNTHYIYVDATSTSLAEDALHLLRQTIGKLVCRFLSASFAEESLSNLIQSQHSGNQSYLKIASYPEVSTVNENGVKITISGLYKNTHLFIDMFLARKIQSLEFEFWAKPHLESTLSKFILYICKNGILIIKKFKFDEPDDANSVKHISDDSYKYTSKMLLVGRYMKLIIESLHQILTIKDFNE